MATMVRGSAPSFDDVSTTVLLCTMVPTESTMVPGEATMVPSKPTMVDVQMSADTSFDQRIDSMQYDAMIEFDQSIAIPLTHAHLEKCRAIMKRNLGNQNRWFILTSTFAP
jgi:hypothetical protein